MTENTRQHRFQMAQPVPETWFLHSFVHISTSVLQAKQSSLPSKARIFQLTKNNESVDHRPYFVLAQSWQIMLAVCIIPISDTNNYIHTSG